MNLPTIKLFPAVITLIGCLSLLVSNGLSISGLSVFDEAILTEFGWDRGQLKFGGMITLVVGGLFSPISGYMIDRYGVKRCMIAGWALLALTLYLYSNTDSLSMLYVWHFLLGVVLTLVGINPCIILVSQWSSKYRGVAIGIAVVGTSLGGIVMSQLGTQYLNTMSWRDALQMHMWFPIIMLITVLLVVRTNTASGNDDNTSKQASLDVGMDYTQALRTRTFWALAVIATSTYYSVLGAVGNLFLHMRDLNFSPAEATNLISLFFLCALVGKFLFGAAADYVDAKKVMLVNCVVMFFGAAFLASMNASLVWTSVVAFGLGWGGIFTLLQLNLVNAFGLKSAGKILGTITVFDSIGGGIGIWLTGYFFESTGSYQLSFTIYAILIAIAAIAMTQVKLKRTEPAVPSSL